MAIGADNRIRTYDLLITNEPLYQLSYTSMCIVTSYSYYSKMSNTPILRLLQIRVGSKAFSLKKPCMRLLLFHQFDLYCGCISTHIYLLNESIEQCVGAYNGRMISINDCYCRLYRCNTSRINNWCIYPKCRC